jgi:hypothetical protein
MVASLDDWLLFAAHSPAPDITVERERTEPPGSMKYVPNSNTEEGE